MGKLAVLPNIGVRLEEQLQISEKMASIGLLAAGVALAAPGVAVLEDGAR